VGIYLEMVLDIFYHSAAKLKLPLIYIVYYIYGIFCIYTYIYLCICISILLTLSLENNWLVRNYRADKMSYVFKRFLSSQSLEQSPSITEPRNS